MDKELKEKMTELFEKLFDKVAENVREKQTEFEEAIKEPCKIHIDNDGKGTGVEVEGRRLNLLITLAGAEKNILKDLHCSKSEFEYIKSVVDSEEVQD